MDGRWDVFVCTGCGECTGRHAACDAVREKTPVVPCDDAAVERGARRLARAYGAEVGFADWLGVAQAVLTAAGEQS